MGIASGAQGFVRNFLTAVCSTGYTYATSALIEISKAKFNSLTCALNEGRFRAYVAASKATPQEGLAILQPVTLENLTHRLPSDLNDMKS